MNSKMLAMPAKKQRMAVSNNNRGPVLEDMQKIVRFRLCQITSFCIIYLKEIM